MRDLQLKSKERFHLQKSAVEKLEDCHLQSLEGGRPHFPLPAFLKVFYKTLSIQTQQENLTQLDPRLGDFLHPGDYFYVHNITEDLKQFVAESKIQEGNLTAQILHTSASLAVNELDEPMLLGDINHKLRAFVPKAEKYLHNGPLREVNLCKEDSHCDRNADAHVRAFLFGHPSVTLIVREGRLILGQWQRVALIEYDGPRKREVMIQLMGR